MSDKLVNIGLVENAPEPSVVQCLEDLLRLARQGDVTLFVGAYKDGDGEYCSVAAGGHGRPVLRAEMHYMVCDVAAGILNGEFDE